MDPQEPPSFVHTTRIAASGQKLNRQEDICSESPNLEPADEGLNICNKTHTCKDQSGSTLPTRLLDVGQSGTDEVKVVISSEESRLIHGTCVPYAALSYCWGTSPMSKSTQSNISSRKRGFSLQDIPLTLRDAVRVTRKLGIQYLWVDALCILQDCKEDWQRESAKMGDVYGQAVITIFAFGARDCEEGLFQPAVNGSRLRGDGHRFRNEPLNRRAWAFQEWHLSPRRILFTSYGTFFDCLQGTAPVYGYAVDSHRLIPTAKQTYHDWHLMVGNYSIRELTNPSDKLPAIAGLAQRFRTLSNEQSGRYLAGHWENDMPSSLLWHRERFPFRMAGLKPARPTVYRAPSWSWASMDGSVAFARDTVRGQSRVSSQFISLDLQPSVGAESSGSAVRELRVRSLMKSLSRNVVVSEVVEYVPLAQALHTDLEFRPHLFGSSVCYIYGDEKMKAFIDGSKCLEFCAILKDEYNKVWGLLLLEVGSARFQRVGCGYCNAEWFEDAVERCIDIV